MFQESYLKQIERKVKVYLTDGTGLVGLEKELSPSEFKQIQDEVILRFTDSNQEKFRVEEAVHLELELKNINKLIVKVFEFNTETYYKKTMKPFDTSIDLQGLEPLQTKVETEMFKDVPKTRVLTKRFDFEELKGKTGLFIIEFLAGGKMSRAVIKKGSITFIHRSTIAGHVGYLVDADQNVLRDPGTGIWLEKKFYAADETHGTIRVPFSDSGDRAVKIIMINKGFAQMGEFMRRSETYSFELFSYLNRESILMG